MIKKLDSKNMGSSDLGWLKSLFHFSFAEYYNQDNMHFGSLRVINDDLIAAGTGFPTHPHKDMEIISYIVDGELTHTDSMGNKSTLHRGEVQYMSAGTGVTHSEYNYGEDTLRLLQIWVIPDKKNYTPNYGEHRFKWEDRINRFLHIVSNHTGDAPIQVHQDVNFYVSELEINKTLEFHVQTNRQCYLVQIEGSSLVNDKELNSKDALECIEENLIIQAKTQSHILIIEMEKFI